MPQSYWSLHHTVGVLYYLDSKYDPNDRWKESAWLGRPGPFLEGIYVRGRLAGVYTQQRYRDFWARRLERDRERWLCDSRHRSDAAIRLGINCVVYALTQEGGLARQLVAQ